MSVKTGISSWSERSLVASGFYPKGLSPSARLAYYASQFIIVENDSAYYALPRSEQTELWAAQTPLDFTINVKAFALLTGHYAEPARLPPDLRDALPEPCRRKRRIYPKDVGPELMAEIARRLRAALEPLRGTGRLGLVLFQYPVWFAWSRDHEAELASLPDVLPGCRAAVEFRNRTWMSDRGRDRTLGLLRDANLVYTCVDEPQGLVSSVPPVAEATSDVALVRFHGRSSELWRNTTATASERFAYLYTRPELSEWVPRIRDLEGRTREVQAIMNNCYQDYAVRNARDLGVLLGSAPTAVV